MKNMNGFGAKTRGKTPPIGKSGWGSQKSKEKKTSERPPVDQPPSYDVQDIKIADIKVKGKRRALNPDKLKGLVESISSLGLHSPITVRSVKRVAWGKTKTEYHLVSGLHRLEAMKQLGKTTIPCFIMAGNKRAARMWEISENLSRADLTPLEYDEQLAEWVRLLEGDQAISGQNVQKKGPGRPKSGISEAARQLPVKGKTFAAKRKRVERAVKTDSIFPEAKDAANKADLSRANRLKVADEKTPETQVAKVRELALAKKQTKKTTSKIPLSANDKKALAGLIKSWNAAAELKKAFIKASVAVGEQFIAKMRLDRSPETTQKRWGE